MVSTELLVQTLVSGFLLGGVYATAAIGLSLTFGIMDIVNLAHGHLLMLGGYVSVILFVMLGISPLVGMLVAFVGLFAVGVVLQQWLINPIVDEGMEPAILVTFGVALLFQNVVQFFLGSEPKATDLGFEGIRIHLGPILISFPRLVTFAISVGLIALTWAFLYYTKTGRAVRATAQNRTAARTMGINTDRVFTVSMGLGAGLAGASGALLSMLFPVDPFVGWSLLLTSFAVVVLGGVGSLPGTIVGGLILGMSENLGALFFGGGFRDVVTFGIFIVVLIIKPSGLWGEPPGEA